LDEIIACLEEIDKGLREMLEDELMMDEPSREKVNILLNARNHICLAIEELRILSE